jgi:hypothetical protein
MFSYSYLPFMMPLLTFLATVLVVHLLYHATPAKYHTYQARFQIHWDSEIVLNYPPSREAYKDTFSLQQGD